MKGKIQHLRAVLHALKDLELARLAAASQKQHELSDAVAGLRQAKIETQYKALDHSTLMPSSLLGADRKWAAWAASQIEAKNIDLAQLAAARERSKSRAQVCFGRAAAFDAILAKRNKRARCA